MSDIVSSTNDLLLSDIASNTRIFIPPSLFLSFFLIVVPFFLVAYLINYLVMVFAAQLNEIRKITLSKLVCKAADQSQSKFMVQRYAMLRPISEAFKELG